MARHTPASHAALSARSETKTIARSWQYPNPLLDAPAPADVSAGWGWLAAGAIVVVAVLTLLEFQQPRFFLQDDNYTQFLPGMLHGCRSVAAGQFPNWNPKQFLGAPLAEVGTYALTYPPTYVSYWFATVVCGDERLTMEFFCWFHLLAGYFTTYWFATELKIAPPLRAGMSLALVLCGFALIGGRSWYYMTPVFLWGPLLAVCYLRLRGGSTGWKWTLATALVIGALFHSGNAQMWAYAVSFFTFSVAWEFFFRKLSFQQAWQAASAVIAGIGVSAPLLVPQFLGTQGLVRGGGGGRALTDIGIPSLVLPLPLGWVEPYLTPDMHFEYRGALYFAGGVLTVAWALATPGALLTRGGWRQALSSPFFVCSWIALMLCMGSWGGLWRIHGMLPVFKQFTVPLKLLPFFHFFALALGAWLLHYTWIGHKQRYGIVVFALLTALTMWNASYPKPAFFLFAGANYPPLPPKMAELLTPGDRAVRVIPRAPWRSPLRLYSLSLHHNFPTYYGVSSIEGYDPLVMMRPENQFVFERAVSSDPLDFLRDYGVEYAIYFEGSPDDLQGIDPQSVVYSREKPALVLVRLSSPLPLAFPAHDPTISLPIQERFSRVEIDTAKLPAGGTVIVSYVRYRRTVARADDRKIPTKADELGRIAVDLPPGARQLTITYESPWLAGCALGAVLLLAGLGLPWVGRKLSAFLPSTLGSN